LDIYKCPFSILEITNPKTRFIEKFAYTPYKPQYVYLIEQPTIM
jgi:hypothetical protein